MTQKRETDTDMMNTLKGSSASWGLADRKISLALVQAACALSLEGTGRATATEVAERAIREYGVKVTASFTGQLFSNLKIPSVTTHGKSRFVLGNDRLEEIRQDIATDCQQLADKLESSVKAFQELPQRIQALETAWKQILQMRAKERELVSLINQDRQTPSRLPYLESEMKKIQQQAVRAKQLEECKALSQKIKAQPKLEERKAKLEAAIAQYQAEEKAIAVKEVSLAQWIEALKPRKGWVSLATLQEAIQTARQQLDDINKQINSRRSFLDKLLHRNEGEA